MGIRTTSDIRSYNLLLPPRPLGESKLDIGVVYTDPAGNHSRRLEYVGQNGCDT